MTGLLMRRTRAGARGARLRSVFAHALHEERRALVGWTLGLAFLATFQLSVYPTVRDMQELSKLLENYPEPLRKLFSLDDYMSGAGYLRAEIYSLVAPLLLIVLGVLRGSDATAGEEDRKTIDLLLANPISRRRVVFDKWAAVSTGIVIVGIALAATLGLGAPLVDLRVAWSVILAATVASVLLAILFASLALAIGAATGRRGLARGISAVLVVAAYLVSSLAPLVSWLRTVRPASPWYHALGVDPLGSGFSPTHTAVLVVLTGIVVAAAAVAFDRRDLSV